jgi:hypothetical protein
MSKTKPGSPTRRLKGWGEIAEFLGQNVSVAQRWQHEGMPVTREGRFVYASPASVITQKRPYKNT